LPNLSLRAEGDGAVGGGPRASIPRPWHQESVRRATIARIRGPELTYLIKIGEARWRLAALFTRGARVANCDKSGPRAPRAISCGPVIIFARLGPWRNIVRKVPGSGPPHLSSSLRHLIPPAFAHSLSLSLSLSLCLARTLSPASDDSDGGSRLYSLRSFIPTVSKAFSCSFREIVRPIPCFSLRSLICIYGP
jgi:hypothetical protein